MKTIFKLYKIISCSKLFLLALIAFKLNSNTLNQFYLQKEKPIEIIAGEKPNNAYKDLRFNNILSQTNKISTLDVFSKAKAMSYPGMVPIPANLSILFSSPYQLNIFSKIFSQNETGMAHMDNLYQNKAIKTVKVTSQLHKYTNKNMPIRDLVYKSARRHGIPEKWFEKLIYIESNFNPSAKSPKGAIGLGQLMPATAVELGLKVTSSKDLSEGSVWNPESNLDASAKYLQKLYSLYVRKGIARKEAWNFAAGAYNAGIGNIQKAINLTGTKNYLEWQEVAIMLPRITGRFSRETIQYVKRLEA